MAENGAQRGQRS